MAIRLKEAGFTDLLILEKDAGLGGTWRQNHYPGCSVDVPSTFYSFSFFYKRPWSRFYCDQPEILEYSYEIAREYDLEQHMRFDTDIVDFTFDEAACEWELTSSDGRRFRTQLVFGGFGPLYEPFTPDIPGRDSFAGAQIHTREWADDFDPTGKTIAVIGSSASAAQVLPPLADKAEKVYLIQRTPAYVIPKPGDRDFPRRDQLALRYMPGFGRLQRLIAAGITQLLHVAQYHPSVDRLWEKIAAVHRRHQISDPELLAKVTPDYLFSCKRPVMSNDFYPALGRPNVEVIPSGLARVEAGTVVTAHGDVRQVDTIVWATGFQPNDFFRNLPITGRNGNTIAKNSYPDGYAAHLGISIAGFPNFFMIMGPYGQLAHTSAIVNIELQTHYLTKIATIFRDRKLRTIEPKPEAQQEFMERGWRTTSRGAWGHNGCTNYLIDAANGRPAIWPGSQVNMWRRTRRVRLRDYQLT